MPSRAEIRGGFETALRAVSLIILAWMFWLSLDRSRAEKVVTSGSANLPVALRDWSRAGIAPDRIVARFDSTPDTRDLDWLRALKGSGSEVRWNGNLPPVGINVLAVASPRGGWTVNSAASTKTAIQISDEVGPLDSAVAENGGARFTIPAASGPIKAAVGGSRASIALDDSVQVKRVLVLGNAGWETKFVVAALEEDGWNVDSDMRVAPGVNVTQGALSPIDTARYSAVIALDGVAASRATEIARYATSGGGVILAGATGSLDAFAAIRPGTTGRVQSPSAIESEPGATTLASLSIVPIAGLRGDAIALERRNGVIAAAARRAGSGRVLQEGYVDTWRWRMGGGDDSPAQHRAWWTKAVATVAYAPHYPREVATVSNPAPVAGLVESLGPPSTATGQSLANAAGSISLWLLFAILSISLLAEWASRRLRGSR
jgi:hypothetical protein